MLGWMRRRVGGKGRSAVGALLNGTDEMWHPTALRAREDLDVQHEVVTPAPSPGDRLLEGLPVVLPAPTVPADSPVTPAL
jgi:hypothetical protein